MAAGTVTISGPYALDDIAAMAVDISTAGGAVSKSISFFQDLENRQVWFASCTQA